jgi:hypothetical protein
MAARGRDLERDRSRSPSNGGAVKSKSQLKKDKKKEKDAKKKEAARLLAEAEAPSSDSSDEKDEAIVIPEDNTVVSADLVNTLCRAINTMTTSMAKVEIGLEKVQTELRQQKNHMEAVVTQVEQIAASTEDKMKKFADDMKTKNDDIDARLAKLAASTGSTYPRTGSGPTYAAAAAPTGAASSGGPAPAAPPSNAHLGVHRPTRIWIKGFKETLTTKYLNEFAKKAVDRLQPEHRSGAKTGAPGFGTAVYIDYPATTRVAPIKAALADLDLKHKDEAGTEHSLRITSDIPLAIRHKGRVLGELWKTVEPHLSDLPATVKPKDFKLGNSNGKLFLVLDHRPLELFATTIDDLGTLHVTPNTTNLKKYQINDAMAQAWIASACRTATRSGQ